MKRHEVVSILAPTLRQAQRYSITATDIQRAEAYTEYAARKAAGEKVEAIIYDLCDRYGITRRNMFAAIKRMKEDIQP